MASGTFERPLPDPADEKALLGLDGFSGVMRAEIAPNVTRYLVFQSQHKDGLLITSTNGDSASEKVGLYVFGSSASNTIAMTAIKAVTRTGLSITPLSNTVIQIVNPSGYMWLMVQMFYGDKPTLQSTLPT